MDIIYVLLPISLCIALVGFFAFRWAIKNGQFDDTDTPQLRMLGEDAVKKKTEDK